jgi:hypothetical protein
VSLDNSDAANWIASNEDISSTETVVGVEDEDHQTLLYPNPVQNVFTIQASSPILSIKLTDAKGRLLQDTKPDTQIASLDIGHYASGLYFVSIKTKDSAIIKKVMKE